MSHLTPGRFVSSPTAQRRWRNRSPWHLARLILAELSRTASLSVRCLFFPSGCVGFVVLFVFGVFFPLQLTLSHKLLSLL